MTFHSDVPAMKHEVVGNGDPLILLGGGLTGWLSWIPHAETLVASRRVFRFQQHCIALGLSGDPLPPDYSIGYEVAALSRILNDLSIEQADFAGWSLGGMITLSYAIHHPEHVRSLTLIEPPAYWVLQSRGHLPESYRDDQRFFQTLAHDDVSEEQLVQFVRYVRVVPDNVDPRTLESWPIWLEHRQSLRIGDVPLRHDDNIDLVRGFEKPVLLVKGEGSAPHHHAIIDALAEELPNAQVVTFPGGHAPHIISMQPFMECFTQFLTRD
jgi:pimeloyl-ACP methyl ester carboxylesterase